MPQTQNFYLLSDFNARVGAEYSIWPTCHGHHGVGKINENGQILLELCCARNLCITNTFSYDKEKHRVSWMHPRSRQWHQLELRTQKSVKLHQRYSIQRPCHCTQGTIKSVFFLIISIFYNACKIH